MVSNIASAEDTTASVRELREDIERLITRCVDVWMQDNLSRVLDRALDRQRRTVADEIIRVLLSKATQ